MPRLEAFDGAFESCRGFGGVWVCQYQRTAHQQQRREKAECLENLKEFDEKHKKFADDGSDMMNDLDEKGIRVFAK